MGRWSLAAYGNCWWSSSQGRYSGTLAALCNSTLWSQCQRCKTTAASYTNAHTRTSTYNSFMSIVVGAACIQRGSGSKRVPKQVRCLPPIVSSFSACFSNTSPRLCHSTSTVAYFLQIHFLIGAAARRCCCAETRTEPSTHKNGWFVSDEYTHPLKESNVLWLIVPYNLRITRSKTEKWQ